DDDCDLDVGQAAVPDVLRDGQEVGAASGEQDSQAERLALCFHVYCTRFSPLTMRPMMWNFSSARSSTVLARVNLAAGITAIKPMPILKVRIISSCETWPRSRR